MKKALVAVMVIIACGCAALLPGCGGDTAKAQESARAADAQWAALEKKLTELDTRSKTMLTDVSAGKVVSVPPDQIASVSTQTDALLAEIETVKAGYQKIKALKGVDDYVKYAEQMTAALDGYAATIKSARTLLEKFKPSLTSGDMAALSAVLRDNMNEVDAVIRQRDAAAQLLAEAEATKQELGY